MITNVLRPKMAYSPQKRSGWVTPKAETGLKEKPPGCKIQGVPGCKTILSPPPPYILNDELKVFYITPISCAKARLKPPESFRSYGGGGG